ncbi:T9SS type A sorting domain-containing protein [Pedobacter helvus]|uniref:T9SS type A sorting domain-containing protein n=1 Tax=Pedobacter helvus TaxID=2563444 RepID=A0ABW9JHW8_9SPHI|nr:T9SS type A sorting domain-containing protein [Pedobacter ureilyticus]
MKKLLLSLFLTTGIAATGFGQIFSQNFTGTTTLSDYINSSGEANKFTAIGSGTNNIATINSGALRFTKTGSGTAHFSRNASFPGPPTVLKISFSIEITNIAASGTTQAQLYVGTGFANTSGAPTLASTTHSRLVFGFDATNGFNISGPNAPTGSTPFYNTKKIITWVINNTGASIEYQAPDGTAKTLANDRWDLYADNVGSPSSTPILDGLGVQSDALNIEQIFFRYDTGSQNATFSFDDFLINDQTTVLPVDLTSFTAKANLQNIDLTWSTASEKDNSHFEILRSGDGKTFSKIGEVRGAGTTDVAQNYSFVDKDALPGVNYYQLNQIDYNGNPTLSKIEAVKSNVAATNFKVVANKQDGNIKLTIFAANEGKATLKIYDLNGRKVTERELHLSKGYANVSVPISGANGLHIASLTTATETVTEKFIQ